MSARQRQGGGLPRGHLTSQWFNSLFAGLFQPNIPDVDTTQFTGSYLEPTLAQSVMNILSMVMMGGKKKNVLSFIAKELRLQDTAACKL